MERGRVTCPSCGSPASRQEVHKTLDHRVENLRMRRCLCGARWVTIERLKRGTLTVTDGSPVTETRVTRDLPVTLKRVTRNPPVTLGGEGGGVSSDLFPVLLPSDPSQQSGSGRAIHIGTSRTEYHEAFEILWDMTGKRGTKLPAYKAWNKQGRPTWVDVQAAWGAYLLSDRPRAGFVQDLSTWLNARGWTQEWPPARNVAPGASGASGAFRGPSTATRDAFAELLAEGKSR